MRYRIPLLALLLLAVDVRAADQFVGLPNTGKLDPQRVLDQRYGKGQSAQPAQPAAVNAGAGAAENRTPAKAQPRAATPAPGNGPKVDLVPHDFKGGITGVAIDSTSDTAQTLVPIGFGQVFAPGEVMPADRLVGKLADGSAVPLQVDVKARHPDGSLRHAVISAVLPALAPHRSLLLTLARDKAPNGVAATAGAGPAALLAQGFRACVSATLGGKTYSACADRLLAGKAPATWLSGAVSDEWLVSAPLTDDRGAAQPQLSARFAVRWYPQAHKARVDVSVENDWADAPGARNLVYDARVTVGGQEVYAQHALNHLRAARWRKLFWWGQAPAVNLRYDSAYLIASRALPNYDTTVAVPEAALATLASHWNGAAILPMGPGESVPYMSAIGGRSDIGLLPSWAVLYLLSMDPRAGRSTFGSADLAGSWPVHYRDRRSDRPLSLLDHPAAVAACAGKHACDAPYGPDIAHQPNLAYLPYLLTGDRYDLDELQFWAAWNALAAASTPAAQERGGGKGLLRDQAVSGQAWGLRALGEAAYITPDDDPSKAYFTGLLKTELDWYNATYTDRQGAAGLGAIVHGNAVAGDDGTALAPWQDDFFTASVGHLAELGFDDARRLLAWKVRFPVARMTAPGVCWIFGAASQLTVRQARAGSKDAPLVNDMAAAYAASHPAHIRALPCAGSAMGTALHLAPGEMAGFAASPSSFTAIMQPALAYAADVDGQPGKDAWHLFMSRSVKPDYGSEPQFSIVPRAARKSAAPQ